MSTAKKFRGHVETDQSYMVLDARGIAIGVIVLGKPVDVVIIKGVLYIASKSLGRTDYKQATFHEATFI